MPSKGKSHTSCWREQEHTYSQKSVMAELEVGRQCTESSCLQLDFLPITCRDCQQVFCRHHAQPDQHRCLVANGKTLVDDPGASTVQVLAASCSVVDCASKHQLVAVPCAYCGLQFCLQHRHAGDHNCSSSEAEPSKKRDASLLLSHLSKQAAASTSSPAKKTKRVGAKSAQTAAKVALVKLKLHAIGDKGLPQSERVFLNVFGPAESNVKPCGFFFSNRWTIGRTVDHLAKHWSLLHNPSAGSKRLHLYSHATGDCLGMSMNFLALADNLQSGSSVILEYSASTEPLLNLDLYAMS